MNEYPGPLAEVASVIQLAVAPVFLLTAVGTILAVLSTRLARVVDRARVLVDRLPTTTEPRLEGAYRGELKLLGRRRHLINIAITCGTASALTVCILIASAFTATILQWQASAVVAVLFILAMIAFIGALVLFLSEIVLAASSTRMEPF